MVYTSVMICELDMKSAGLNVWQHARHLL